MDLAAAVVAEHKDILTRTEALVWQFRSPPAGAVIATVARARADLLHAGVGRGLAAATEARVRAELSDAPAWSSPCHTDRR